MLVVKPNPRRMRYMRDSPSERFGELHRPGLWQRLRWERVALALGLAGIAVIGLVALSSHF